MNGLEIGQVVVLQVHTDTEEETSVTSVDNLEVSELTEEAQVRGLSQESKIQLNRQTGYKLNTDKQREGVDIVISSNIPLD